MTAEQRRVFEDIRAGPRGRVAGPFRVWLRSPGLADRAQKLGAFLRFGTTLRPPLRELAILLTARSWDARYEWQAHEPHALEAGLDRDLIAAVAAGRRPRFADADAEAVHDLCVELHETHGLSDATYAKAQARLGDQGIVELVGLIGYYTMLAMTLNAFRVPLPGDAPNTTGGNHRDAK